jgi:hypothetical protein
MIEISLTKEINGAQLAEELGIDVWDLLATENTLMIKSSISKKTAEEALEKHVPVLPTPPTIQQKLQRAGIDLDELRAALGLPIEEIAAL